MMDDFRSKYGWDPEQLYKAAAEEALWKFIGDGKSSKMQEGLSNIMRHLPVMDQDQIRKAVNNGQNDRANLGEFH